LRGGNQKEGENFQYPPPFNSRPPGAGKEFWMPDTIGATVKSGMTYSDEMFFTIDLIQEQVFD
jgi:hypothetical protein